MSAPLRLEIYPGHLATLLALVLYPWMANNFFIVQIGAQSLFIGTIALSLMFLAGYGGMVSLSQLTVAGFAGYFIGILGPDSYQLGFEWPWWVVIPSALILAVLFATLIGAISIRTEGIYTIMITLAIGTAFYYLCNQNYTVFNGFTGFAGLKPPTLLGIQWRDPKPFYYLSLTVAVGAFLLVSYLSRAQFGIALQAIRDNPRRMHAIGYDVAWHCIAAHTIAGLIAGCGGILLVWFNGRISPGTIGVGPMIDILIVAVIGGMKRPIGPFIGAVVFIMLKTFAIDFIDRERFNTLIGLCFLAIVLFSSDGLLGWWDRIRNASHRAKESTR